MTIGEIKEKVKGSIQEVISDIKEAKKNIELKKAIYEAFEEKASLFKIAGFKNVLGDSTNIFAIKDFKLFKKEVLFSSEDDLSRILIGTELINDGKVYQVKEIVKDIQEYITLVVKIQEPVEGNPKEHVEVTKEVRFPVFRAIVKKI